MHRFVLRGGDRRFTGRIERINPATEPGKKGEPEPPQLYEVGAGKHLRVVHISLP